MTTADECLYEYNRVEGIRHVCERCHRFKFGRQFYRDKRRSNGRRPICITCDNKARKVRRWRWEKRRGLGNTARLKRIAQYHEDRKREVEIEHNRVQADWGI